MIILPGVIAAGRQLTPPAPPSPHDPHRYWRVQVDATLGSFTSVGSLQMMAAVGQINQLVGGTPIESGHDGSSVPANAFDSNLASFWRGGANGWIGYDLGAGNEKAMRIFKLGAPQLDANLAEMPSTFRIQFSDDAITWYTFFTVSNQVGWRSGEVRTFLDATYDYWTTVNSLYGSHNYWQLAMFGSSYGQQHCIGEMEFRPYPTGTDQATGGTASATSNSGASFVPSRAFDNNTATSWESASTSAALQWGIVLSYQFTSAVYVGEAAIRSGQFTNEAPLSGMIRYSDDGVNWTMGWYFSTGAWTTTNEIRAFPDPDFIDPSNGTVVATQEYIELVASRASNVVLTQTYVEAVASKYAGVALSQSYIEVVRTYQET